jgi:hypothetical protein
MRRIAVMVALACGGLVACGGGGHGGLAGDAARSGGSEKDSAGAPPAELTPAGDVDPSVCPPVDEVAQRAGESLGLTYAAASDGDLDCEYASEDSDLMVKSHCEDYASLETAVEDIEVRVKYVPGTEPYDSVVGDEAVIQNMEQSDPMLETLGYRVIVRQGVRICQALWATDVPTDPDQDAGRREMLDYVMATMLPAA